MSGPNPVVFLHPLGVDGKFWDPVRDRLPGLDCFAPNLPGHGSALKPVHGFSIRDYADAVVAELDAQSVRRFHIVGVSLGGLIAQDIAARHPELVDRLVLADTVAVYPEQFKRMWHERAAIARDQGLRSFVDPTMQLWFTPRFRASADPRALYVRESLATTDPKGYAIACEALALADSTGLVSRIKAPTLVVCGTDDAPPFVQAMEWFDAQLSDATMAWIENAQHGAALERPDEFAALVSGFLV